MAVALLPYVAELKVIRPPAGPDAKELLKAMPADLKAEVEAMLADPELIKRILVDVAALGVAGEHELAASIYLIGTSRVLDRPLAAIVQGLSSSGKSFLVDQVGELFPPEALIRATAMTPQALYHLPPGSLVHPFVMAGERSRLETDEAAERTKALASVDIVAKMDKQNMLDNGGNYANS